jgi:hypothetical protein
VVDICNGVFFSNKNEIMLFAGKWMQMDSIMLSKINQAQKNITFSLMWNGEQ